jgi:sugar lactone lactonase YvrE
VVPPDGTPCSDGNACDVDAACHGGTCTSQALYSCSANDNLLRTIGPTSGITLSAVEMTIAGDHVGGCAGLAADSNGQLWALVRLESDPYNAGRLVKIAVDGTVTLVGAGVWGGSPANYYESLAFGANGTLFTGKVTNLQSAPLYTVSTANGALTPFFALSGVSTHCSDALAFNPSTGRLHYLTGATFLSIDTGAKTVAAIPLPPSFDDGNCYGSQGLTWWPTQSKFLAMGKYGSLYAVTPEGSATVMGHLDHSASGLAFAPSNGPTMCQPLDQCHIAGVCDPVMGCSSVPALDGTWCDDGNSCSASASCIAGVCVGTPIDCVADECHPAGTCDPNTGLCPVLPNSTGCDDGNPCTTSDTCKNGSCTGTPRCPSSDQCHTSTCDPVTLACAPEVPVPDYTGCDDGNRCTDGEFCYAGSCTGAYVAPCLASDACHSAGACDPSTGLCSSPSVSDGTVCNNNLCQVAGTCQSGVCDGSPVVCTPSVCHGASVCDVATGACSNAPVLPDGTPCQVAGQDGTCTGGDCHTLCNDGIQDNGETGLDCGGACPACETCLSTLAGSNNFDFSDGIGAVAGFNLPGYIALDAAGNLFVADTGNNAIRKVTPNGQVTTVAGTVAPGYQDGAVASAQFNAPQSVAVDAQGNLYVADTRNAVIRRIGTDGNVTTVPGTQFQGPTDVRLDAQGNIYVIDGYLGGYSPSQGSTVWRIKTDGTVTLLMGTYAGIEWSAPPINGLALDALGNVYATTSGSILKIDANGFVTDLAGWLGKTGGVNGPVANDLYDSASFANSHGIAIDLQGNLYVAESSTIRKVSANGVVSTIGGVFGQSTLEDGCAAHLPLFQPWGIAIASDGTLYMSDLGGMIRRIGLGSCDCHHPTCWDGLENLDETAVDCGGSCPNYCPTCNDGIQDQGETSPDCGGPCPVCTCSDGIQNGGETGLDCGGPCPSSCNCADGIQNYLEQGVDCGGGCPPCNPSCGNGVMDQGETGVDCGGPCPACPPGPVTPGTPDISALCASTIAIPPSTGLFATEPTGLAVTAQGNLIVTRGLVVDMITPAGGTTTLAGSSSAYGYQDGPAASALFASVRSPVVDKDGNIFVIDGFAGGAVIRKIGIDGNVTTLAGDPAQAAYINGPARDARFVRPNAMALDSLGNLYVADGFTVRKIGINGLVTTVAGIPDLGGRVDGPVAKAQLGEGWGIVVDPAGNVYVSGLSEDFNSHLQFDLRKIGIDGLVTTLPVQASAGSLALDGQGNLFTYAHRTTDSIWKIGTNGTSTNLTSTAPYDNGAICAAEVPSFSYGTTPEQIAVGPDGSIFVTSDILKGILRLGSGTCTCCFDGKADFGEPGLDCGHACSVKCDPPSPCDGPSDCKSAVCTGGICKPPSCTDSVQNGTETDVDCGGGACPACKPGDHCTYSSDCNSFCGGGICQPPTCFDGIKNQGESAPDCGGPCPACPSCSDSIKNQGETGTDCGGPCTACSITTTTGAGGGTSGVGGATSGGTSGAGGTSGSGGGVCGGLDTQMPACNTCISTSCCTEAQACLNDSGCLTCLTTGVCSATNVVFNAFEQCYQGCCHAPCLDGSSNAASTCGGSSTSGAGGSTSTSGGSTSTSGAGSSTSTSGGASSGSGGGSNTFSFVSYENCESSQMMVGCGLGSPDEFCAFMSSNVQGRFYSPTISVPGGTTNGHFASQLASYTGNATLDAELLMLNDYGMQGVGGDVGGPEFLCTSLPLLNHHVQCHSIGDQSGVAFVPTIVCTYAP